MIYKFNRHFGYEVSSAGDKRFSAFYAKMADGRSIEEHYQCDIKGYPSWSEGKGKPPLRECDLYSEYLNLWRVWSNEHLDLLKELAERAKEYDGFLSDKFATTNVNQASALAHILNEMNL